VVARTVLRTPDDGRKEHPKHVEKSCSEIKYTLLNAASRWKLIYIRLVMHGTMNVKSSYVIVYSFLAFIMIRDIDSWAGRGVGGVMRPQRAAEADN
jgi:hypothetical protein